MARNLLELKVNRDAPLVVACSGGIDSVALTRAVAVRQPLVIAHIDHGLREASSRQEECRCVDCLGEILAAPVMRRGVSPGMITARAAREGRSLEEVAREERYRLLLEILQETARETGADPVLLTAHHLQDQLETFVMKVFSGRSPLGLLGIPRDRWLTGDDEGALVRFRVVRPLLGCRRQELKDYVRQSGLPWFHDPTNDDLLHLRNRVRLRAVPVLEDIFSPSDVALRTASFLQELDLLREGLRALIPPEAWGEFGQQGWSLDAGLFRSLPRAARELVLREAVYRLAPGNRVSFRPFRGLAGEDLSVVAGGLRAFFRDGRLQIRRAVVRPVSIGYLWVVDTELRIRLVCEGRSTVHAVEEAPARRGGWHLGPVIPPVVLRSRRKGERVFQRGKQREVARILESSGVSPLVRACAPVVEDQRGVVALLGQTSPLCIRDGVQYTHDIHARPSGFVTLEVAYEEAEDYAERE
ncbi:tRNA lysidine(34) synthetase TilS [Alkalispirochaeta americana]|uniref:tRNA lysidine(34) synthetase TilS n=1 Tax=Alkalispirochaeta americana TaxID=159291 RepID=UPI00135652DB|nr:tRNA lysidine(34) synthetase TilS [Alkalispirochaeta americana]